MTHFKDGIIPVDKEFNRQLLTVYSTGDGYSSKLPEDDKYLEISCNYHDLIKIMPHGRKYVFGLDGFVRSPKDLEQCKRWGNRVIPGIEVQV